MAHEAPSTAEDQLPVLPDAFRYRPVGVLGKGGMSTVYTAIDQVRQQTVALKMPCDEGMSRVHGKFFHHEAKVLQKLGPHRHVVGLLDSGEVDNFPYLALDLEGGALRENVHALHASLETSPSEKYMRAFRWQIVALLQATKAAQHAHAMQLTHGDLKSGNVLWDGENAKVIDWAFAVKIGTEDVCNGTLCCMSPEQARGERLDERTDVFGLGALFYQILTNKMPYERNDSDARIQERAARAIITPVRVLNPQIPEEVAKVCEKAMSRNPRDRYPDCGVLQSVLRDLLRKCR